MAAWVGNYIFQSSWRKTDPLCPDFPKFLILCSHQCCSSMCRCVCCIPASLLQFSQLCQFIPPHASHSSDVTWAGPIAGVMGCLWLLLIVGVPEDLRARNFLPCGISMWNPCICWLYSKEMDKAQHEGCSRGAMVPSQRLRDAASWEKERGKTKSLISLVFSENWVLQKPEFYIAIANQPCLFR